jgi:hypothetical protein
MASTDSSELNLRLLDDSRCRSALLGHFDGKPEAKPLWPIIFVKNRCVRVTEMADDKTILVRFQFPVLWKLTLCDTGLAAI